MLAPNTSNGMTNVNDTTDRGRMLNLKRDISAFEESYKTLLKTLKYIETHVDAHVQCAHPPVEREQSAKGCDLHHQRSNGVRGANVPIVALEKTLSKAMKIVSKQQLYRSSAGTNCSMISFASTQNRMLKLDQSWVDMHRAYEEEADARLDELLEPAPRMSYRISGYTAPRISLHIKDWPVVHPHSPAKIVWDSVGCVLLALDLFTIPVVLAWDLATTGLFLILFYISLLYWPLDVLVSFNTGYYLQETVVENRKNIFVNYCRGWLPFDVLLICIDFFLWALPGQKSLRTLRNVRVIRIGRLLRIMKFSKTANTVTAAFNAKGTQGLMLIITLMRVVLFHVLFAAHIMACAWFYVGRKNSEASHPAWIVEANLLDADGMRQYIFSIHWVLAQVTPAPINVHPQNADERLFALCVIIFSLFVFGGSLAKLRGTLDSLNAQNAEKEAKKVQLRQYLKNCEASVELSARTLQFAGYQLDISAKSVTEPPFGLVPKALMDELLLSPRRPTLINHPLFLLIDIPFAHHEEIIKKICSEGLVAHMYGTQQKIFTEGTLAQWLLLARTGSFEIEDSAREGRLKSRRSSMSNSYEPALRADHKPLTAPCWFAEVCLFTRHIHSSTLSTASVGEVFTLSRTDLISCVKSSPIVIVSVAQYARAFLARVSSSIFSVLGVVPDYLPPNISKEACCSTHLHLLEGSRRQRGESDWERSRQVICASITSGNASNARDFMESVFQKTILSEMIGDDIQLAFPELDEGGVFRSLDHIVEGKCVIAAISSAVLLMNDQYDAFVMCQEDDDTRLTLEQWVEFQDLVGWANLDPKTAHAVFVFLLLRGLVKSKKFGQVCAPKARATRERMLIHCLTEEGFEKMCPSIALLDQEQITLIIQMCDVYEKFNMPQFLQGENLPHSLAMLQELLSNEAINVFRPYLFSQVCMMCGLSGSKHTVGSAFMTSAKAVPVLLGVLHLREIETNGAFQIYFSYILTRAIHVGLHGIDRQSLAFARLICLSRIVDREGLKPLQEAWNDLSVHEKKVLTDHFITDGIEEFAIILLFVPLYLSNALANEVVGTLRALRILVDVLQLVHAATFAGSESLTGTVDMSSLAEFTGTVHSSQAFEDCLDWVRFRKVGDKFLVVVDEEQGSGDLREQVVKIHRTVKQIVGGQAKIDALLSGMVRKPAKIVGQRVGNGFESDVFAASRSTTATAYNHGPRASKIHRGNDLVFSGAQYSL